MGTGYLWVEGVCSTVVSQGCHTCLPLAGKHYDVYEGHSYLGYPGLAMMDSYLNSGSLSSPMQRPVSIPGSRPVQCLRKWI